MKEELRFLYVKKHKLNENIYIIHLEVAKEWGNTLCIIERNISAKLEKEVQKK